MRLELVDGIRGHLLIGMLIAHLSFVSGLGLFGRLHHNYVIGLYDAEFFIPVAGFLIGYLVSVKLSTTDKFYRMLTNRLVTIYKYYIVSAIPFLISVVIVASGLSAQVGAFLKTLLGIVFMQKGGMFSDILPIYFYSFLVVLAATAIMGIRPRLWLIPSFLIYMLSQIFPNNGFFGLSGEFVTFNIAAWQFLFMVSIFVGFHWERAIGFVREAGAPIRYALLIAATAVTLALRGWTWFDLDDWVHYGFSTNYRMQLHPVHLLHIAAAIVMFAMLLSARSGIAGAISRLMTWYFQLRPLKTVGKYSIQMFVLHCYLVTGIMACVPYVSRSTLIAMASAAIVIFIAAPNIYRIAKSRQHARTSPVAATANG